MKKLFAFLLTVTTVAACAVTFSACGNGSTASTAPPEQDSNGTVSSTPGKLPEEVSPPQPVYHTVTYTADGETYAIRNVKSGATAENFTIPSTEAGTFEHWMLNGEKYDFTLPVTSDLTLEAKFKAISHTATFSDDSGVYATYEYYSDLSEIEFPEVPSKPHHSGEWVQKSQTDGNTEFIAVYTPITYEFNVFDEHGEILKTFSYTVYTSVCDIESNFPLFPQKDYYTGNWSTYALYGSETSVRPEYTPLEYTITFVNLNGETVGTATYTVETTEEALCEPPVPELEGYENGRWEDYELNFTDLTVRPVYDKSPAPPEMFTEGLVFALIEGSDSYKITDYLGTETDVVVPSLYCGKPVTVIADEAFINCNITGINLPESLLSIGKNAFCNCKMLKSIKIPDSVHTISPMVFAGCTLLESVTLGSGLTRIQNMTFVKCTNLQTVILGSRETVIDKNAFYECPKIEITYPAQTGRHLKVPE